MADHLGAAVPVPEGEESGERRRVTVLFADFVGYSTLAEYTDPEELRTMITEAFTRLRGVIEAHDGRIEKFIGDAVMAIFGAPLAHEDDPARAVQTALEMIEVVQQRSAHPGSELRLRIGINSGLVVAGRVGDGTQAGVMGDAVNVAARLQQVAGPNEIVISAKVWRRIRGEFETLPLGQLETKGREQAVDAFRVLRRRSVGARRQAPFVGRVEELALLELLWSNASKGNPHVVTLVGEPGIGKSRLLAEFPQREDAADIRIACESKRPFGVFIDLLQEILGALPADLDALQRRTDAFGLDEKSVLALATLLGLGRPSSEIPILEPEKRQIFTGVWQLLLAAARTRPALMIVDDVHRSDASSLDLLDFLLERLGGVPLMLVLAHRPGFEHLERIRVRANRTAVHLELLSREESFRLAQGFLEVEALPPDLEALVATRAEGNAFFIEELLQALLELGSLAVFEQRVVLVESELDVPDTVQGTIQARVDRLPARERRLLQHLAVIGPSLTADVIEAVMGEDVSEPLEELVQNQLLLPRGPGEWAFKHALIQEVTYETLLRQQRRELHRRVAEALEDRASDDPAMLEAVAEHFSRAEALEKARRYALAAGDAASERMGVVEARDRYRTALRLWGKGDDTGRLRLLMKLGYAELLSADTGAARTTLIEAEAGWRAVGDLHRAGAALALLGRVYFFTGEMSRAADALYRGVELLESAGPSQELVRAFVWNSVLNVVTGRAEEGARLATRGLEMAEELSMYAARSHLLNSLGVFEVLAGDPAGLDRIRLALHMVEGSEEAEAIGRAYLNLTKALGELFRLREALTLCERGREACRRVGAPTFEWLVAGIEAQLLAELGRNDESEDLAREILGPQRQEVVVPGIVHAGTALTEVLLRCGRYAEARNVLDETIPPARRIGGSMFLAPILLLEAEVEEARGNAASADQALRESLQVALGSSAVVHVFRPLVTAARLLPTEESVAILDRVRPYAVKDPSLEARFAEASAIVFEDEPAAFRRAADLYASLELPYQEARCCLEAHDLDRAMVLIRTYEFDEGPLGSRFGELAGSALT